MIGYDGNGDNLFDIHELQQVSSLALSDTLQTALNRSFLNLSPFIFEEGTNRSDHAAFWLYGFPAIMFGEAFLSGDENPAYHTVNDRIDLIDLSYFHDLAQLGASTVARLAVPVEGTNVNSISDIELSLYPNPADDFIRVDAKKSFTFNLYDLKGSLVLSQNVADSDFIIDISRVKSGVYIAKILGDNLTVNRKLIIR